MKKPIADRRSPLHQLTLRGVRIAGQRKAIIDTIQTAERHLDAVSLLELARRQDTATNRATVCRTPGILKKLRLVGELDLMHLSGEKHFYEAKTGPADGRGTCDDSGESACCKTETVN